MRRIGFTAALVALAVVVWFAFRRVAPPRHVVLIVVDTLRADHIGAYGYARSDNSPVIDALASEGLLFERAISQASFTSPSMVSLMSGLYIAKERSDIPESLPTLAESFRGAGWRTAGFVSNPVIKAENGFARGFERFERIDEYGSNTAIDTWFGEVAGERSFTYIHITEPHDPYDDEALAGQRKYREKADYLPGDRAQFYERIAGELKLVDNESTIAHIRSEIGGYDDDVRYADRRVGEFLAALDKRGMRERAAVVLTSDHGEGLWERVALMSGQRRTKLLAGEPPTLLNQLMPTHGNQVSRELVHVPLVITAAGIEPARVAGPVENVDLFPTLLALADIAPPAGLHGVNLLDAAARAKKDHAFSFTRFNATVITADGWQLVWPTPEGECAESVPLELFDLNSDPHQRINLAAREPERVARMQKLIDARLGVAIKTAGNVTPADIEAMRQLGYTDLAITTQLQVELAATSTDELIALGTKPNTFCMDRLRPAEALAGRDFDAAQRAALEAWRAKETSTAVQRALDAALGK